MALIKYGAIIAEARGKESGIIFSRNAYGGYIKNKVSPINPQTTFQQQQRAFLGSIAQQWSGLTQAQRDAWDEFGQQIVRVNRFGDQTFYTGFNAYVKVNRNRSILGLASIAAPVSLPSFPSLAVGLEISVPDMSVSFTPTPLGAGLHLVIDATPPIVTGRRFVKNFYRLVQATTANPASSINITTAYELRFSGFPSTGSFVGVRVRIVHAASGWDTSYQVAGGVA